MSADWPMPERGASVRATDGQLGTVKEVVSRPQTGEIAYLVVGRGLFRESVRVPAEAIESITDAGEVHLRLSGAEAIAAGETAAADGWQRRDTSDMTIPLLAERLVAGTRSVDLGELRLHLGVDTEQQRVDLPITRDQLDVEHLPIDRVIDQPSEPRHEGEWLVIPIMREELVVQKRLRLVEEVRIRTRQVTVNQPVQETVRRTRLTIEDATVEGVNGVDGLKSTSGAAAERGATGVGNDIA